MVGQRSTETVLPESEILLLEHDLHYRNITKELSLGNALVGISLMLLILLVGIGVAMLYHLAFFYEDAAVQISPRYYFAVGKGCPPQHSELH